MITVTGKWLTIIPTPRWPKYLIMKLTCDERRFRWYLLVQKSLTDCFLQRIQLISVLDRELGVCVCVLKSYICSWNCEKGIWEVSAKKWNWHFFVMKFTASKPVRKAVSHFHKFEKLRQARSEKEVAVRKKAKGRNTSIPNNTVDDQTRANFL